MKELAIIGVASGQGARDPHCGDGPQALAASGPVWCLAHDDPVPPAAEMLYPLPPPSHTSAGVLASVAELNGRLARVVEQRVRRGELPVIVGGDHSCAVGTWSGVRAAANGGLGLLWVDAHMDSHVPRTSPSGALHGMPLACLLGRGERVLTELHGPAPKLDPAHVCLLGVRSFERGEAELLRDLGVRVIFMEEVVRRGLTATWAEALQHITRGTAAYGITIDLDAVDPREAPGVGSPAAGGLAADELVHELTGVRHDPRLLALEIAEYNPYRDRDRTTLALLRRMLCAVGAGKEQDEPDDRARAALLRP